MNKKIILGLIAVVVVAGGVAGMSAYEAHVINVTAKIENALTVTPDEIMFGTVFPQEYVTEDLSLCVSSSFTDEARVDDVNYVIKQKPKPKAVMPEGLPILKPDINMYMEGGQFTALYPHWIGDDALRTEYCHTMSPADAGDPDDTYYINCYPVLCSYLSKHKAENDSTMMTDTCAYPDPGVGNPAFDCGLDAFHQIGEMAYGHLVKSANDNCDLWVIDLDVPCFEGQCAQDWTHQGWELPAGLESEVFGCDLWIEVTGISEMTH